MKRLLLAILLIVGLAQLLHAQSYELLTDPLRPFLNTDGSILALGKLRTCTAGATCTCTTGTPLATYSDSSGTPNTNPVILDSTGKATVYGSSSAYKLALCTSTDVSVKTQDNIIAVGLASLNQFNHTTNTIPKFGGSNTLTTSQITDNGTNVNIGTPNSLSAFFGVATNSSTNLAVSQASTDAISAKFDFFKSRGTHASPSVVVASDTTWTIRGFNYNGSSFSQGAVITSAVNGAVTLGQASPSSLAFYTNTSNGSPTLRLFLDSNGVANFSYRIAGAQGTDTASANKLTLPFNGNTFVISGATQINLLDTTGWTNGSVVNLYFSGAPTVKNAQVTSGAFATISLNGNADYVAGAGRVMQLVLIGGGWYEIPRKF